MIIWQQLEDNEAVDLATDIHIREPIDMWLRPHPQSTWDRYQDYFNRKLQQETEKLKLDSEALSALRTLKAFLARQ